MLCKTTQPIFSSKQIKADENITSLAEVIIIIITIRSAKSITKTGFVFYILLMPKVTVTYRSLATPIISGSPIFIRSRKCI